MDLVVALADGAAHLIEVTDGRAGERAVVGLDELPALVASRSGDRVVWAETGAVYPTLLRAGVRVRAAVDLRLQRAILRRAAAVATTGYARAPQSAWDVDDAELHPPSQGVAEPEALLFDVGVPQPDVEDVLAEHLAQLQCLDEADDQGALRMLCHAESVGGLIAAELNHTGVPFDADVHDRHLTATLGERDRHGGRPARMAALVEEIRVALDAPRLNPDSAPTLVQALRRAGLDVQSTRKWELRSVDHPVIEPLLAYKQLSRLHTANGWAWMQSWVRDGRFRPDWVPGAVVTGRWASRGGGALQLPKQIRAAIRADPGWRLVVADAAQLEPRVLAAMAHDTRMAQAAAAGDLYQALVDEGVVETRAHAKVAMLGAMYGATTGEAGALMPSLASAYPRAVAVVEDAARRGERGERVSTWLGRTSPEPPRWWHEAQAAAQEPGAGTGAERRARQVSREWGRFTRNFVVQGTAAEWALCWMGHLRRRLDDAHEREPGPRAELVYFLHDEVIVHAPAEHAEAVAEHVRAAAEEAGRLLFGEFPVSFPLDVAVVDAYDDAG